MAHTTLDAGYRLVLETSDSRVLLAEGPEAKRQADRIGALSAMTHPGVMERILDEREFAQLKSRTRATCPTPHGAATSVLGAK